MVEIQLPLPATKTTRGVAKLLGGTADAPDDNPTSTPNSHAHRAVLQPVPMIVHTNNMTGTDFNLYPSVPGVSVSSFGNYVFVLNSSATFSLMPPVEASSDGANPLTAVGVREPETYGRSGFPGISLGGYQPLGIEMLAEIIVTFIQDDVGGWTPAFSAGTTWNRGLATPSWGSGTAGKIMTCCYRYCGPFAGYQLAWSTGWTSPGSGAPVLANSSGRGGQYVRGVLGTGGTQTNMSTVLDGLVKSPLNYRKFLYQKSNLVMEQAASGASPLWLNTFNLPGKTDIPGTGQTYVQGRHVLCYVSKLTNPIESTLHETGHAFDFTAAGWDGATLQDVNGQARWWLTSIAAPVRAVFNSDRAEWVSGGGTSSVSLNAGWSGSDGYFLFPSGGTEWAAQVIGSYMHRKWCVANSQSTSTADGNIDKASNPTRRSTLLAALDTALAAYNT